MNNGQNMQDFLENMRWRSDHKHDVVSADQKIIMRPTEEGLKLDVEGDGMFEMNPVAHRQIASVNRIPNDYYNRMRESSEPLAAYSVNHFMQQSERRHMVRTIDGKAGAVVSDSFLRLDNEIIAQAVLPVLHNNPNVTPLGLAFTDLRMHMKMLFNDMEFDITGKGDLVKAGISMTNSEVGFGSFNMQGFFYRSFCDNGCVFGKTDMGLNFTRRHLGSKQDVGVQGVFSQATMNHHMKAIMSSATDIMAYISSRDAMEKMAQTLRETTQGAQIAPTHIVQGVEVLGKQYGLTQGERALAVGNLIENNDFSRWGVLNSFTKVANNLEFDRAGELEAVGGKIIDLHPAAWESVVERVNAMPLAA